jgi:general secretion pathway protein A
LYESWYGFAEKPFSLTPDPKYLYLSPRHTEAFAHLQFGHRERGGFVVITGEVGTGKTTLARYFLGQLGAEAEHTSTAMVLYPAVTAAELLRSILDDFHLSARSESLKDCVDALHRFLLQERAAGRHVLLLIDEAQDLSPEVLEQVRLISNLETDTEKLLTIVLMGQSEFAEMLSRRELRQLAQRVTARYHLTPLDAVEVEDYVRHRLQVAGGAGKVAFTRDALKALHRATGGVPRLVNLACDRALLGGYVAGTRTIDAELVRRAWREVGGEVRPGRSPWLAPLAVAAGIVLVAAAAGTWIARGNPVAATAAPGPTRPATTAALLEPLLRGLSGASSQAAALDAVAARWPAGPPLQRASFRSHLEQVRRFDLPVALELFHPARRDTCWVGLLAIEGDVAVVAAGGAPVRVPLAELDRHWTRLATFLWRDEAAAPEATARVALARLGLLADGVPLADGVARFQAEQGLAVDGVIGSRTLLALASLQGGERPRLSAGGGA